MVNTTLNEEGSGISDKKITSKVILYVLLIIFFVCSETYGDSNIDYENHFLGNKPANQDKGVKVFFAKKF